MVMQNSAWINKSTERIQSQLTTKVHDAIEPYSMKAFDEDEGYTILRVEMSTDK